ncbi:MAG: hypothetical protein BWY31_01052 [Lentisphaerae bacterium ADurb.Bin242]|nr:MAG: hypothetical protein BWY31_01052 [Lentisphaerae bacterium ADurb.Bin242]
MKAVSRSFGKKGQVLSEYAFMLAVFTLFTVMFFVLMAAFSQYGARLIGLVSWEPSPPSRSQMESIMNGTL